MSKKYLLILTFAIVFLLVCQTGFATELKNSSKKTVQETDSDLPSYFSWRNRSGVDFTTPIRAQQPYASCETFAFVGALETMVQWKVGYPFGCDLSEAHLYFWSNGNLNWGSYPENDTNFLVNYGIPDEACWPYPNYLDHAVMFPKNTTNPDWMNRTVKIEKWSYLPSGDINAIKDALVTNGPVPTYLNVYEDFQRYRGGIYRHVWGESVGIHLVCIVGYQDSDKIPSGGYWIVKNSWGVKLKSGRVWGENGWFRIAYGEASIEEMPVKFEGVYGHFPILYVDDDNTIGPWDGSKDHPYKTINDAIEKAYPWWTVFVYSGTYNEKIIINKTINLDGENKENTIIDGNGADVVVYIQAPDVRVSGFTIQNSGTNRLNSGIRTLSLNSNATIKNCILQDCDVGLYLNYAHAKSGNIIHDNIIRNNRVGVFATWANNNNFSNNKIYGNSEHGIELEAVRTSSFTSNEIFDNSGCGLYLHGASNENIIDSNNFTTNSQGIKIKESKNNIIKSNNFINNNIQASFEKSIRNKWKRNYWSDWERILPRKIKGTIGFWDITWVNFDWRPYTQPV